MKWSFILSLSWKFEELIISEFFFNFVNSTLISHCVLFMNVNDSASIGHWAYLDEQSAFDSNRELHPSTLTPIQNIQCFCCSLSWLRSRQQSLVLFTLRQTHCNVDWDWTPNTCSPFTSRSTQRRTRGLQRSSKYWRSSLTCVLELRPSSPMLSAVLAACWASHTTRSKTLFRLWNWSWLVIILVER